MSIIFFLVLAVVLLFSFVVFFGAPYLPTLTPQVKAALDLLDLRPGETMLEIGSGDGKVLLAAAERGWQTVGYELNPILVLISKWRTRKVRKQVRIIWGNAWSKQWPEAEGIYIFGLDRIMPKLHTKIVQTQLKPVKLVSFTFRMPDMHPAGEKSGVFLYNYRPDAKDSLQSR